MNNTHLVHLHNTNKILPLIQIWSIQKTHSIKFEFDVVRREALINELLIKNEHPAELILMLNYVSEYLSVYNILFVYQQIEKNDWEQCLSKLNIFEKINYNEKYEFYNVRSKTNELTNDIMKALGFDSSIEKQKN